jgi:glycosyltransferase 2 family protein
MSFGLRKYSFPKIPSWLIPALGYTISIVCLIWVLRNINIDQEIENLRTLHWGWVALAVIAEVFVYFWQGWRWNLLLRPVAEPALGRSVRAIYVGLFANEVIPLRPGEVIRCYLQARWSEIPFSVSFGSAVIERVFDGIWLILAFFAVTLTPLRLPPLLLDIARLIAAAVLGLTFILGIVMFRKHHAHAAIARSRWGREFQHRLSVFVDNLHAIGQSRSFWVAAGASLPYLLLQVVPIYALMQAYSLGPTLTQATVVLIVLRMGTVLPQAPGNLGSTQALIVAALTLFGVDKTTASGLSVVMWIVITVPLIIGGFIATAMTGVRLSDIHHHANAHMRQRPPAVQPAAETQGR